MDELLKILFETDDPADVWELDLSHQLIREEWPMPFERLGDLRSLTNLKTLSLSGHELTEIAQLPSFSHLLELDVSYNYITDANDLPLLPQLETLNIGHNQLLNLPNPEQLPVLGTLIISGNKSIRDLSVLQEFSILHTLYLKQLLISNWKPLRGIDSLVSLYATPAGPRALAAMQSLQQLQLVDLNMGRLGTAVTLPSLPLVKKMTLQYAPQVKKITGWEHMGSLEILGMKHLGVSSIPGAEVLGGLKELRIQNCPEFDLGTLVANSTLKRLYIERVPMKLRDRNLLKASNPGLQIIS